MRLSYQFIDCSLYILFISWTDAAMVAENKCLLAEFVHFRFRFRFRFQLPLHVGDRFRFRFRFRFRYASRNVKLMIELLHKKTDKFLEKRWIQISV